MLWGTLLLLVCATPLFAEPDTGGRERLREFMNDVRSLEANFSQTLYDENQMLLEESRGTVSLKRPGKFRWDYAEPYPQVIVADGEKVWVYDGELEQVTIRPLEEAAGNTPAMLLSSEGSLEESFSVSDLGESESLAWVALSPKDDEASFSLVKLGFAGSDLAVMELMDNFGQTTRLRFSEVRKNQTIDPQVFSLDVPEGVDVIESGNER
jgi:outer membrane lipoprotein carrier protein